MGVISRFIKRIFGNRWFTTLLGVLLLSVLIWFFGPLLGFGQLHPFDSELLRLVAIGALLALWVIVNLLHVINVRKKEKNLVAEVSAPDATTTASAEEVALLSDRLKEALTALKKAKLGGRSGRNLYQLPWYMFIGPPGAGKTTALINSGLKFPLAEKSGPQAVHGVGGTRNCDWWFTDEAVLIDTAGRYTTQDSQAAVDSASWLGFLKMLKRNRRRQPLNGILLAISLSDLSVQSEQERLAHAHAIRKRMRELQDELGVRLPVYVFFTKVDLISGFSEFFETLGKEDRENVWGMTFPLDDGKSDAGIVAQFGPEFDLLVNRLNDRMLERVHGESDMQRRRLIYGFPEQITSLKEVASEFLTEIFRPSRLEARSLLRGVYFTSGTQDGTSIDRLMGTMASQFGLQRQAVTAFSGTGRSYFLTRLMREVIFGEANLVSQDPKVERRTRWIYRGVYAGCAALLLFMSAIWAVSYLSNRDLIAEVHTQTEQYNTLYRALIARGPQDTDLPAVLPPLDALRAIDGGYEDRENSPPLYRTFGLYQGGKLSSATIDSYYRALNSLLVPRLLARLEKELREHLDKPDYLYETLKVYLILGRQGPLDADTVEQWAAIDFELGFPGEEMAPIRASLMKHVTALVQRPLTAIPLDAPLIAQVRGILTREPLAEYSYNRIMRNPRIRALPAWTVAEGGGPASSRALQRRSGASLSADGVPGAYTWAGFHTAFLALLPTVTLDLTEDAWVLGKPKPTVQGTLAAVTSLRRDVLGLYLDDYTRRWDAMIADISIKPFGNLQQGVDILASLSSPESPLRNVLVSIDQQTQLSRQAATDQALAGAENKVAAVGQRAAGLATLAARAGLSGEQNQLLNILGEAAGTAPGGAKPVDPVTRVDQHFIAIHNFVTAPTGRQPPIEMVIAKINNLYQTLNQVANSPNQGAALLSVVAGGGPAGGGGAAGAAAGGGSAAAQLKELAKDLPKPIATMLQSVSDDSSAVTSSGASQQLSDAWKSKVLPLCTEAFNRYPFVPTSTSDVPSDDFARLLGPNGLIDGFFNENLKTLVDTSQSPWKWQAADGAKLGLQPSTLSQFEKAAQIRDSLFSNGTSMQVKFQLVPVSLDPGVGQITLDFGGQSLTYNHGPTESMAFQWPASTGKTLIRVIMTAAAGGQETVIEKDGPWALLRILDAAKVIPSGAPDKFRLVFTSPAGSATFELNASSVRNPFTLSALRSFRCPPKL